ncbi:hypothetical protein CPB84DRAFT_1753131 [Gymnopilus junonius]|uniref:Uncharacterized protein n=1 Tax=Gymnopilus junonius TaxID=109634 RepID=A0A9P5TGN3_GYMJU|nr:hypothetical protein CPB84DRAFT_1753131 [Gymnopilus junonius]
MAKRLDNFQFNFIHTAHNQSVGIGSSVKTQAAPNNPTAQTVSGDFPTFSHSKPRIAVSPANFGEGSSGSQLVLHPSRRRRASRELIPDLDNYPSGLPSGGWHPVRLQGYSEDPMKDEIIKGQTETIKLLQMQLRNLQMDHSNFTTVNQCAQEVEVALQDEQAKTVKQEILSKQLGNQLQTFQASTRRQTFEDISMASEHIGQEGEKSRDASISDMLHSRGDKGRGNTQFDPKNLSVPLPLSFKRVRRKRYQAKNTPPPVSPSPRTPPVWTTSATTTASTSSSPSPVSNPMTALEANVDLIMNSLGISNGKVPLSQQRGRRLPHPEFKPPSSRVPKIEGRQDKLDRDILNFRDTLYAENTPLQHEMKQFEKDARGRGPSALEPMQLFNTRCNVNLDHLPDDMRDIDCSDEETKCWVDRYKITEALGIEGASSDETDPYDSDTYCVHALKWRNKKLAKRLRVTDAARRTTNKYGDNRPGTWPRTRKRRIAEESQESIRKVTSGLPINCHEESWYNSLSPKKKWELQAKPALELLADWESE